MYPARKKSLGIKHASPAAVKSIINELIGERLAAIMRQKNTDTINYTPSAWSSTESSYTTVSFFSIWPLGISINYICFKVWPSRYRFIFYFFALQKLKKCLFSIVLDKKKICWCFLDLIWIPIIGGSSRIQIFIRIRILLQIKRVVV